MRCRRMTCTSRVQCHDGKVRSFEIVVYATSTLVLRSRILAWDGQAGPRGTPYEYFETPVQAFENDRAPLIDTDTLIGLTIVWNGPYAHNYEIIDNKVETHL